VPPFVSTTLRVSSMKNQPARESSPGCSSIGPDCWSSDRAQPPRLPLVGGGPVSASSCSPK